MKEITYLRNNWNDTATTTTTMIDIHADYAFPLLPPSITPTICWSFTPPHRYQLLCNSFMHIIRFTQSICLRFLCAFYFLFTATLLSFSSSHKSFAHNCNYWYFFGRIKATISDHWRPLATIELEFSVLRFSFSVFCFVFSAFPFSREI